MAGAGEKLLSRPSKGPINNRSAPALRLGSISTAGMNYGCRLGLCGSISKVPLSLCACKSRQFACVPAIICTTLRDPPFLNGCAVGRRRGRASRAGPHPAGRRAQPGVVLRSQSPRPRPFAAEAEGGLSSFPRCWEEAAFQPRALL